MKGVTNNLSRAWKQIYPFLTAIFVFLGTMLVLMYARGYRLDIASASLEYTGVLSIETKPSKSIITVDNEEIGKSPKTVSSIKEGSHKIKITKEGYHDWTREVDVLSEKSSPVYAELFLKEPKTRETIFQKEEFPVQIEINQGRTAFFIMSKEEIKDKVEETPAEQQENEPVKAQAKYRLREYRVIQSLLDLKENPRVLFEETYASEQAPSFKVSPDSQYILITTPEDQTFIIDKSDLTQRDDLDITDFSKEYTSQWSQDSNYLIFSSPQDIFSYNIETGQKTLLYKSKDIATQSNIALTNWTTDSDGYFYTWEKTKTKTEQDPKSYTIKQYTTSGEAIPSASSKLKNKIYYKDNEKYLNKIKELSPLSATFTNAPENTRFIGEITDITINTNAGLAIIETEKALYSYDIVSGKYRLINPSKSELLEFSPDNKKFNFFDKENNSIGIFLFEKDEDDPTTEIGGKIILENVNIEEGQNLDMHWMGNSKNLIYHDTWSSIIWTLNIIDIEGGNKYSYFKTIPEVSAKPNKYIVDSSDGVLYQLLSPVQFSSGNTGFMIVNNKIR